MNSNINFPNIVIDPYTAYVYTGCGFTGSNAELTFSMDLDFKKLAGLYDARYLELKGITSGKIQSFIIGPHTKMELYEYDKFGGRVFVIYNSTPNAKYIDCFDDLKFDMHIRSIKIYPATDKKFVYATMFNNIIHKEIWEKQMSLQIEGFEQMSRKLCENRNNILAIMFIIMFLIICCWKYKL